MNPPSASPPARRLTSRIVTLRRWAATLGCLLLLMMVSNADDLYDFTTTDLRGTPAQVNFRTGRRSVTRSRRRQSQRRQQRQARTVTLRRERRRYVSTRPRLRLAARPREPRRTRVTPRSNVSRMPATAQSTPRVATGKPARAGSQARGGRNTTPTRPIPPVLARVPGRVRDQVAEKEQSGGGEEVRQNLSLAFVTPSDAPAVGVQLVAHVTPAGGEEATFADLTTDSQGRVKLQNIALPAAIDLDFPSPKPAANKAEAAPDAPPEWDFSDADKSTLLLKAPLGPGRDALVPERLTPGARAQGTRPASTTATRRVRLFEGSLAPIVLERQVVDIEIAAPAGSRLSSPALEEAPQADSSASPTLTVPPSGRLGLRLPREVLDEGPIPIRVAHELAGGEAEALIETYSTDSYKTNVVQSPPLRLARLSGLEMAGRVGVMGTRANIARHLGDLKGSANRQNALGQVRPLADGSEWWSYPEAGIAFKMRLAPDAHLEDKSPTMLVERVRLYSANAGSFGTVAVGSTVQQMRDALGDPQTEDDRRTLGDALSARGQIDTWLDGGLRVCHDQSQVLWLESARPNSLLTGGTTAFVRRNKARLFVESFAGDARINLRDAADLRKYLGREPSIALARSPEEADFVLQGRVSKLKEETDAASGRRTFVTSLQYSLFDTALGRFVAQGKQAQGTATVDAARGAPVPRASRPKQNRQNEPGQQNRARAQSGASAVSALVSEVNRASDFSLRVTAIDYAAGTLRLNAGRTQGLRISRTDPDDFQITVAGTPLPEQETTRSLQVYTARVVAVGQDWAECRLLRVTQSQKMGLPAFTEEPAPDMVRRLPDPATGQVGARSWMPFPSDVPLSNPGIEQPRQPASTVAPGVPLAVLPRRSGST